MSAALIGAGVVLVLLLIGCVRDFLRLRRRLK